MGWYHISAIFLTSNLRPVIISESVSMKLSMMCHKKKQMDIIVKYYDKNKRETVTHYYNSSFLGRTTAEDLLAHFKLGMKDLNMKKMVHISMDGPNVNWKFPDLLKKDFWDDECPRFLEYGSCGLHVIHGAIETGHLKAGWKVHDMLSSAYYLFKGSPARRAEFTLITGSTTFPMKFCKTRWVENVPVDKKFLLLFDQVKKFMDKATHTRKARTALQSWQRLEAGFKDPFMKARIHFFIALSSEVEPFLRRYQTASPYLPFLYDDLSVIVENLLKRYVQPSKLENLTTKQLAEFDLDVKDNLLTANKVKVGLAVKRELNNLKTQKKLVADLQISEFYQGCALFTKEMCKKILERSPLKYNFVRFVSSISPSTINNSPDAAKKRMEKLLLHLAMCRWISNCDGDAATSQFDVLCRHAEGPLKRMFEDWEDERLDNFYSKIFHSKNFPYGFKELESVFQAVFVPSCHGRVRLLDQSRSNH